MTLKEACLTTGWPCITQSWRIHKHRVHNCRLFVLIRRKWLTICAPSGTCNIRQAEVDSKYFLDLAVVKAGFLPTMRFLWVFAWGSYWTYTTYTTLLNLIIEVLLKWLRYFHKMLHSLNVLFVILELISMCWMRISDFLRMENARNKNDSLYHEGWGVPLVELMVHKVHQSEFNQRYFECPIMA